MWQQRPYDKLLEESLIKQGKGRLLSRLLAQRNIKLDAVDTFLSSDYKNLSHPHSLYGVEKAVDIFCKSVKNGESIAFWTDYDADGVLSGVMIKELCNNFGIECTCMFASRLEHGYGLNEKSIKEIKEKCKDKRIDLLFVLDSGTNSFNEIEELKKSLKCKIIIVDHHLPSENYARNADALISWHFSKESKQEMCAAGEVFQFIRGIRWLTKKINPIEYLSLTAIATVADVSPIIGNNRIIVKNGLTEFAINHIVASGLKALMQQSKIYGKALTQQDISFKIAPKINAVGRVFNPDIVFGLLIERDHDIAENTAEYIIGYNEERKKIQKQIEIEAIKLAEKQKSKSGILVIGENWHIGVVGIVASKLVETFNKPAIVVGKLGKIWKGSGRSVKGVNIKEILDTCPELFETYGGHALAVGVTLKAEMVEDAHKIFDKACDDYYAHKSISKEVVSYYDAMIDVPLLTPETSIMLRNSLYPYCVENNSEPIFMIPQATIMDTKVIEKETWRLLTFYIERNGKRCPYAFKFFTKKFGTELEGVVADIFFSFPQNESFGETRFSQFELSPTDIVTKETA